MSRTRIYQPIPLTCNTLVHLDEKASHHLGRVLRFQVSDQVILFNGQGGEYQATITHLDKKKVIAEINDYVPTNLESPIDIFLAQGIARGEKMDFIVQKAVELGVQKIFPLLTERSNVRLDSKREEKRLQHWRSIIISACEQSGRNQLPDIAAPQTLSNWLEQMDSTISFVLTPHVGDRLSELKLTIGQSLSVIIGPEGGLSEHEMMLAMQKNAQPLRLGPRVLRTETATITALSVLQAQFGDLK